MEKVEDQIVNAWALLKERHGENGTDDLENKFIIWDDMGFGYHPEDIEVKKWYYETSAILTQFLKKQILELKGLKKLRKIELLMILII